MAKKIAKDTVYTYSFSHKGNVSCTVDGGTLKIWISGTEDNANTYTATGQAQTAVFLSSKPDNNNPKWVLHLKGIKDNNTVSVTLPSPGTWNPTPSDT